MLILGRCFVELALDQQHIAEEAVDLGDVGPQRENLAIRRRSLGQPPGLCSLRQGSKSIQLGWLGGVGLDVVIRVLSSLAAG